MVYIITIRYTNDVHEGRTKMKVYKASTYYGGDRATATYYATRDAAQAFIDKQDNGEVEEMEIEYNMIPWDGCTWDEIEYHNPDPLFDWDENIKQKREWLGLTQEGAAKKLEIPKGTLRNYEQGIRKPAKWVQMMILEKYNQMIDEKEKRLGLN